MEAECFVDATSPSPSKICNISVISYSWDSHLSLLHVDLSWDPPAVVNGVLSGYNVSIGTRLLKDQDDNFPLLGYIWDSTNSTASIDLDFTGLGQSDLVLQESHIPSYHYICHAGIVCLYIPWLIMIVTLSVNR